MRDLYWLASYPKSGNTWLRILLDNLVSDRPESYTVNDLSPILTSTDRRHFDESVLLSSGLLCPEEIEGLRSKVHIEFAQGNYDKQPRSIGFHHKAEEFPQFIKAHDAYKYLKDGTSLLGGARAAKGVIYIVRDPRAVAPSYAHHINVCIDDAITYMADGDLLHRDFTDRQPRHLPIDLFDWSGHVASWLDQTDVPVHLVRYEDLQENPVAVIGELLRFVGQECSDQKIARAVEAARFDRLQAQEKRSGFREAATTTTSFFRRGVVDGWRDELTKKQIRIIETRHAKMMARLGYAPFNSDL